MRGISGMSGHHFISGILGKGILISLGSLGILNSMSLNVGSFGQVKLKVGKVTKEGGSKRIVIGLKGKQI